jgi:uncharacterized membrane protein (DUF4010 family)
VDDLFTSLLISACLGALIGLERQWDEQFHNPGERVPAGVRTFTLWALIGTLCAHFSREFHAFVFGAGLLGIILFLSVFLVARAQEREKGTGFTTAAVAVLTYMLGGLVYIKESRTAVIVTIAVVILLAGKPYLHALSQKFTKDDVRMALQFGAVTGIILPLVPNENFGPYGAFNPRSIWLMVVLVSSVGFFGYVAVRIAGPRLGIALTGILGGLASSTATTLAMSRLSKAKSGFCADYALAVIFASTVMLWRILFLVVIFSPALTWKLTLPMLAMSVPGIAYGFFHFATNPSKRVLQSDQETYRNPLSLKIAIQFAVLYAFIVLAVRATGKTFGDAGIYFVSFFSGLTDLDAISLTLSQSVAADKTSLTVAAVGIVIAACANSLLKAALAAFWGSTALSMRVGGVLGATILIGALSAAWLSSR